MKLSQAIRLGAMLKPQATGRVFSGGGSCALGAALDAVGIRDDAMGWMPVYDHFPITRQHVAYPGKRYERGAELMLVGSCCWILNDADHWTREQVADWVETIEQQQDAAAPVLHEQLVRRRVIEEERSAAR